MKLYYAETPNGMKPLLFLEEHKHLISQPVEIARIDLAAKQQFAPWFLEISPNNKIPALQTDLNQNFFESGLILEYLADTYLYFMGNPNRYEILKWLYWQVGGLGPMGGQNHHFQGIEQDIPYAIERYVTEVNRLYKVLDGHLSLNEYIGGNEYHIADMAIYPWIWYHELHRVDIQQYPSVQRWFTQVKNKPSVQHVYKTFMGKLNFSD